MLKAYGYVRTTPAEEGSGATHQRSIFQAYERLYQPIGYEFVKTFVDLKTSCTVPFASRPQGYAVCMKAEDGDVIIFAQMSHAWISTREFWKEQQVWMEAGVRCLLLDIGEDTGTEEGRKFLGHLKLFVEMDRYEAVERREDREQQEATGFIVDQTPYGWRREKVSGEEVIVPYKEERTIGLRLARLRNAGMSSKAVAEWCNEHDIRNPRNGREMTADNVATIVLNETRMLNREGKLHLIEVDNEV